MSILADILRSARPLTEFATLVADPPWKFDDKLPGDTRGAEKQYRVMTLDDLRQLELPPLAADCRLFMWRVSSMVEEAYSVVRAWGFVPKTELVWRKLTVAGNRHFGMGRTLRAEHETCIVATRGRPQVLSRSIRSVLDAQTGEELSLYDSSIFEAPVGRHSEKPELFRDIVDALSPGPIVELFARSARPGWTALGNQVPGNPTTIGVK